MDKLLIVPRCQFGYNTDYLQMAKRLGQKNIAVEMICFDQGHPKVAAPDNVRVVYVDRKGGRAINFLNYVSAVSKSVWKNRGQLNWAVVSGTIEFGGVLPFLLKAVSPKTQWIMDIRTCSVLPEPRKRRISDRLTVLSSYFFQHVTIISELVAERMRIKNYHVLPLGADCYIDLKQKKLNEKQTDFLYVGKFDDRRVEDLIRAFDEVSTENRKQRNMHFHIVGFSERAEPMGKVMGALENAKNPESITFHGRKTHEEILPLFQKAAVGFSYVPITEFFDVQPPTKTFEYIMNGMVCIATRTKANAEIITAENGVLIEDNVPAIVEGIGQILRRLDEYDSVELAKTVQSNEWANITENFYAYLKKIEWEQEGRSLWKSTGKRAE